MKISTIGGSGVTCHVSVFKFTNEFPLTTIDFETSESAVSSARIKLTQFEVLDLARKLLEQVTIHNDIARPIF